MKGVKMTEYVKKDGNGACFSRVSKNGVSYYNGSFTLEGKEYWISLFPNKTQQGNPYVSFTIKQKETNPPVR